MQRPRQQNGSQAHDHAATWALHSAPPHRARKLLRDVQHRFIDLSWLRVQENDRFLFSWPRSGNTWLRHVIFFYFNDSDLRDHDALNAFISTLEHLDFRDPLKQIEHEHWRFMKSYEPAAPYFLNGRVAYIVRDGRDATLPWYHYRKEVNGERTDFDTFLRRCLKERTRYGSWAHNVGSWLEYRGHPALKIFRYEDILTEPAGVFEKILDHFGISADGTRITYAVEQISLDRVNRTFATLATSLGVGPFSGRLWRRHRQVADCLHARAETLVPELFWVGPARSGL